MHFVYLPKFCITIVFDFSSDDCNTPEKSETKAMQNLGRGVKQAALWSMWKWWITNLTVRCFLMFQQYLMEILSIASLLFLIILVGVKCLIAHKVHSRAMRTDGNNKYLANLKYTKARSMTKV